MSRILSVLALIGLIVCANAQFWGQSSGSKKGEKMRFEDLKAITLRRGQTTAARRSSAVPQLNCIGGSACSTRYEPDVVQCHYQGNDQWKCEADLERAVRFGETTVTCEGYDYPDDPYILKGSCGLEYTLEYTSASNHGYGGYGHTYSYGSSSGGSGWLKFIIFCVAAYVIWSIFKQIAVNNEQRQRGAGGFGYGPGGPGGGGPYGPGAYQPPPPGCSPGMSQPAPAPGGWQPGFWTGLGLGGFLSNMFRPRPTYGYAGGWGSGWGGGWGSPYGGGWGGSRGSFGGGLGGGGGGSRTASGFGGTRRR